MPKADNTPAKGCRNTCSIPKTSATWQAGFDRIIGFDMGGTSTDVCHFAGDYEQSFETEVAGVRLRAPMMISGPGIPAGQHLTALTYLYDLYPTLLSLVDVAVEEPIHGEDLRPLWDGDVTQVRDSLYLSMGKTQRAVTDGRFKLCVYPKVGHRQLFDLAADPLETMDLAGNPAYGGHIARLERELATWRRVTGDPDPLVVDELAPLRVDLTGAKRQPDRWQPAWIREKYFDPPEEAPAAEDGSAPPAAGGAEAKKQG